jgi:predicted TIM-barrel fold metal-dependent hydrolase
MIDLHGARCQAALDGCSSLARSMDLPASALEPIRPYYEAAREALPPGAEWFDAHTHTGQNDPDGFTATADEILGGLDLAGHARALVFSSADPSGYGAANDRVIAEAAASGGRLIALARLDPKSAPVEEAQRALAAGAAGFKLHPRAEAFTMSHPEVQRIVAIADERRLPIMIHAGRGIPALGRDTVALAERFPGARLILAHAGISDLSWLWHVMPEVPNLFVDTAWWSMADLLTVFARIAPGQILYASDAPYGNGVYGGLQMLRGGLAVGLDSDALAHIAGGQVARLAVGADPADLGPAPGPDRLELGLGAARVLAQIYAGISRFFVGADGSEPLALARLACDVPDEDEEAPLLREVGQLIDVSLAAFAAQGGRVAIGVPALAAAVLAATPGVPLPDATSARSA